eukprot:6211508-Pleurochrysis_carterae.AAC.1
MAVECLTGRLLIFTVERLHIEKHFSRLGCAFAWSVCHERKTHATMLDIVLFQQQAWHTCMTHTWRELARLKADWKIISLLRTMSNRSKREAEGGWKLMRRERAV